MIASPCVKVCVLLPDEDVCAGCYRTLEEIALWSQYDDSQRERIIAELPVRRVKYETPSP